MNQTDVIFALVVSDSLKGPWIMLACLFIGGITSELGEGEHVLSKITLFVYNYLDLHWNNRRELFLYCYLSLLQAPPKAT